MVPPRVATAFCVYSAHRAACALCAPQVRTWFYLHDTFAVGGTGFWPNITQWCDTALPGNCALPLTRWTPSASVGLYDAKFLASKRTLLTTALKNRNRRPVSATDSQSPHRPCAHCRPTAH